MLEANFQTLKRYRYLLSNLIVKDIKLKYRRSILGILWSVLNPLLMMIVISAVFSNIFKFQVENFPLYYLTGSTLFNFMSESTNLAMMSILNSRELIKKIYIPKYIFPIEKCLFGFVNFLFSLIAVVVMFIVFGYPLHLTSLLFFIPAIYTLIFSMGLGMILSALGVFFRDVIHLYSVVVVAWNYFTPIVYPYEILGEKMKMFMQINPMYYFVSYFRDVTMYNTVPGVKIDLICIAFSVGTLIFGLWFFKKTQDRFILYV